MSTDPVRRDEPDQYPLGPARLAFFTPVREYPPLADRKAAATLAAFGLMITTVLLFAGRLELMADRGWGGGVAVYLPLMVGFVLAILGCSAAIRALIAPIPPMPESLAYYRDIAGHDLDEYRRRVMDVSAAAALRAMLDYNYSLAALSKAKFRTVDRALNYLRFAFIPWVFLLAVVALVGFGRS